MDASLSSVLGKKAALEMLITLQMPLHTLSSVLDSNPWHSECWRFTLKFLLNNTWDRVGLINIPFVIINISSDLLQDVLPGIL